METGKKVICFDIDGTIVNPFDIKNYLPKMQKDKTFFYDIPPYENMLKAFEKIVEEYAEDESVSLMIITSLNENPYCQPGKEYWISKNLTNNPNVQIVYAEKGVSKSKYVKNMRTNVYLIDDYSENLRNFVKDGGSGIKAINQINGSGTKWKGARINVFDAPDKIVMDIKKIVFE